MRRQRSLRHFRLFCVARDLLRAASCLESRRQLGNFFTVLVALKSPQQCPVVRARGLPTQLIRALKDEWNDRKSRVAKGSPEVLASQRTNRRESKENFYIKKHNQQPTDLDHPPTSKEHERLRCERGSDEMTTVPCVSIPTLLWEILCIFISCFSVPIGFSCTVCARRREWLMRVVRARERDEEM